MKSHLNKILDKFRTFSFSERDKGDRFESLMQAYLLTDTSQLVSEIDQKGYQLVNRQKTMKYVWKHIF